VLVDDSTQRTANAAIEFEPFGDQHLKGKSAPVPAFRAVRVIAERGGRGRADRLEAPLVARDDEFRLIKELFHATARERRPRLVSITGQAGVGKSRLVSELSRYIDGIVDTVYWHAGRSPAYGEGIAFWALGEMVRFRAGLAEADDEQTTRSKVRDMVTEWVLDEEERDWIENALLVLLGVETTIKSSREELFTAWRTFFERIAKVGPVVLLFEDLELAVGGTVRERIEGDSLDGLDFAALLAPARHPVVEKAAERADADGDRELAGVAAVGVVTPDEHDLLLEVGDPCQLGPEAGPQARVADRSRDVGFVELEIGADVDEQRAGG